MNGFTITLYDIARDLAKDLGRGVRGRAEAAIDTAFNGRDLRTIAVQFVIEEARELARAKVAVAEREATRTRLLAEIPDLPDRYVDRWEYMTEPQREAARKEAAHWREIRLSNEDETRGHIGPKQPGSWSQDNPCGDCKRCRETWAEEVELEAAHHQRLQEIYDKYEANLRKELFVEWTEELLSAEIAMPDGSRTTWGLATVEQHQLRHDMLARNAMANAVNAARHAQAIETLTASGALNLATLVEMAPADSVVPA
jgi:hypothetical protein